MPTTRFAPSRNAHFSDTHWSLVVLAGGTESPQALGALETLCRRYWYPLYAFARRQGHDAHDAQDLTQEFFARLIEGRKLRLANPERGRFRSFLLSSFKHFVANEWVRRQAQKRGGGQPIFSLDEAMAEGIYQQEPASPETAERLYDKRWAVTLLERAIDRLATDYARAEKEGLFNHLKPWLMDEASNEVYRELAAVLGMSDGAIKVALHRLRQRFRDVVRDEVGQTVASPADVDEELRCLMESFNS